MTAATPADPGGFADFVARCRASARLVVQPRMGFASPRVMRQGLLDVKAAGHAVAGTLTLDSYTRTGDHDAAMEALRQGHPLNGYPLVSHGPEVTRAMLAGVADRDFAVQVRHGSPQPLEIVRTLLAAGLDATEGGPVSYCLPYGRLPLRDAIAQWRRRCELLAAGPGGHRQGHLETFAGCMLGQLCPPALLVALSVLEGLFFRDHGLRSVSLSYAQQTSYRQDVAAVRALRTLANHHLAGLDWHVVIYTYMGVYPRTYAGARELLRESVQLAVTTGSERIIVKTPDEGFRIPGIADNVATIRFAAAVRDAAAVEAPDPTPPDPVDDDVLAEASALVNAVLDLHTDVGAALATAFRLGYLDIPFCLHPDNAGRARSYVDGAGYLRWADTGSMPLMALVDAIGNGLFLAVSVVFFTRAVHLSPVQVGAGMSVGAVLGLAGTVPCGMAGDRFGPKRVLVALSLWRFVGFAAYAAVHAPWQYFVVVCLVGIPNQAVAPLNQALVGLVVPEGTRVRAMAALRALRNVGFGAGALVATAALSADSALGYRAVIAGDAVTFLLVGVALLRLPVTAPTGSGPRGRAARHAAPSAPAPVGRRRVSPLRDGRYLVVTMLNGVLSMHMTLLGVGIPLWIVGHTAAPPAAVGVLLVLNTVLAVVFQLPISRGLDTGRGAARLLGRSGAVLGVSCMLLAAAARVPAGLVVPVLVVAVLVHTLGELQQSAGGWALSFQLAPPDRQSSYLSLFSIGVTVQRIVGPVLVTSVVLTRGTAGWVGLAAVLLAAGFATTRSRRGRHLQRPRHRRPRRAASRPPQVALRPPASVATLTGACAPVVLRNPPTVRRRRARTAAR